MSMRRAAAAVGIAVTIGGLGGAAIYAATDAGNTGAGRFAGGPPPNRAAVSHREHTDPAIVRSETVLADSKGGFTTTVTQSGTITALSPTALTVRSSDGFMQSYTLPDRVRPGQPGAAPPFQVDDAVLVRATRNGDTLTVTSIGEPLGQPAAP